MKDVRHIIPISGKDSLCTALVQMKDEPDLNYEFLFNPTGSELPEVFDWLKMVETYLGKPINHIGRPLLEIIEANNYFLPSRLARYCTRQSKIEPMLKDAPAGNRYQFERLGYFYLDPVTLSKEGKKVFNRIVTLKDEWARIDKKR